MCEIANKIKARRLELGLTLEDVAQAVGVGRSTVQRWESGLIKNMGRDKIAALANILQMNPVELVPFGSYGDHAYFTIKNAFDKAEKQKRLTEESEGMIQEDDWTRLEALHQDPRLGLLFDRTRKMSHDDVEFMLQFADRILKERDGDE